MIGGHTHVTPNTAHSHTHAVVSRINTHAFILTTAAKVLMNSPISCPVLFEGWRGHQVHNTLRPGVCAGRAMAAIR